ncbi:fatty acid desaturase-domain-containing protein [Blastocladiella britannica]|nr:fatty acid desaturase-domain-containing protein [Blastocladiella britannica]
MPAKIDLSAATAESLHLHQTPSNGRKIATTELAQHNMPSSAWVAVRGKVYDVTSFLGRHPGGTDVLLFAAGRDATQVFESYHQLKVAATLPKYYIGDLADNELPVFPAPSAFFATVKRRVYDHLSARKLDPKVAYSQWTWYAIIYASVAASWYYQFFMVTEGWSQWLAALVLGFFCAQVGLNPLHDASHFTISHSPLVWRVIGASHDFINGSSYVVWIYQHMLGHHPYTNIAGADPDIVTGDPDVRRIKPSQRWFSHYMYQEWFVPVLYGVLGIKTRIQDVSIMYQAKTNDKIRINPMTTWHTSVFWLGKLFFLTYRFVVPIVVAQVPVIRTLGLFLVADLVSSYWLALTFQANHVVGECIWPVPNANNEMELDWAEMQLRATQDYAHDSTFWTKATGALNYQSCHHLFPEISQAYYPLITRDVIMPTCKEFNVPYLSLPTFTAALTSHLVYLKVLGLGEHPVDVANKKGAKAE